MINITLSEAASACGGKLVCRPESENAVISGVQRDSRHIQPGDLFLCIKGAKVDGHDFADRAYQSGAVCCLAEKPLDTDRPYILVNSVLDSVRYLAKHYRSKLKIPVVGIVGSVGKTTAKEMTAAVLGEKYTVLKTPENLNNELGVPLTVLSIGEEHTAAVIEMGISDFGEMSRLAEIVKPEICVITTIGYCHLENLGDLNGVMKAKGEVFDYMPKDGVAVLNGDDAILRDYDPKIKKVTYGIGSKNDFSARNIVNHGFNGIDFEIVSGKDSYPAHINAYGSHTVSAALAAFAVGTLLGIKPALIASGIEKYETVGGRAAVINTGSLTLINDCYNANPNSVKAGLTSLSTVSGRKVAILGDMLELGDTSPALHHDTGVFAGKSGIDCLICCGPHGKYIYEGFRSSAPEKESHYFAEKEEFLSDAQNYLKSGDTVLIKASHGMHFDEIVEHLKTLEL